MNEDRIDQLREFLRRKWLPAIKRWEAWKSKIRLSLELQLILYHSILMLLFGLVIFIPLGVVIFQSELRTMQLCFHYSGQEWHVKIQEIYQVAIMLYVAGMVLVADLSQKNVHRVTNKMSEIIKSANRITINNLEEERLNIEGTQNELKDIAITVNSMLDRLQEAYELQKQFVSNASHELRTPIAVIQGYINMLDRWGAEDPEVLAESVEAIKNEAASMQELVEKLLFLSRHDKHTLQLKKRQFDAGKMMQETVKESALIAKDRNIVALDMNSVILYGDRQMLKECIRILLENAIKYSEEGDSIYIGCEKREGNCVFTVADTGRGMEEKDMEHMFQRFYRADEVRNGSISGHGLGLSIAKLIVLKHVGMIKVKSQYTRGTCFEIILPIQYSHAACENQLFLYNDYNQNVGEDNNS